MVELIIKSTLGAVIVWLIIFISRSKNYYISGLVPLFPTFALISHFVIYYENDISSLKDTILFGMLSLISYFVFLIIIFLAIKKYSLIKSIFLALTGWTVVSILIITLYNP